jgi:hypothetical protein
LIAVSSSLFDRKNSHLTFKVRTTYFRVYLGVKIYFGVKETSRCHPAHLHSVFRFSLDSSINVISMARAEVSLFGSDFQNLKQKNNETRNISQKTKRIHYTYYCMKLKIERLLLFHSRYPFALDQHDEGN